MPNPAPAAAVPPFAAPGPDGTRLRVRVVPRASKTEVCGLQGEALKIRLQAPPVDGKANAALCAFVAEALGLPKRAVSVLSGETSRDKVLLVAGSPDLSPLNPHS